MADLAQQYLTSVDASHRREFGQYFTPPGVAEFMCRWVMEGSTGPKDVFDPAVGLGAFLRAAREIDPKVAISGIEIDRTVMAFLAGEEPGLASVVRNHDYLLQWGSIHSRIVCNPPYMRFQKFLNRSDVSREFEQRLGVKLSGYTNIASTFLLKSLSELQEGGSLAYLMPLEFLNTGYGKVVKEYLLANGRLKALIRLDDERGVFPDAITSVGIVLVRKDRVPEPVKFYSIRDAEELARFGSISPVQSASHNELAANKKWLRFFDATRPELSSANLVTMGYYGAFSRGIATGANDYFALRRSKIAELKLPLKSVTPCLTRSSQIRKCVFQQQDFDRLRDEDGRVFVLNVNGDSDPRVRDYIRYGESERYHERYLTKVRSPWYKLEKRKPAPILFGVFSRQRFKAIRNHSNALNLTCFHGFNPNMFGQSYVDSLFLYFQSRAARRILALNKRKYGDGLDKFEPNDLNDSLAPSPEWFNSRLKPVLEALLQDCEANDELPDYAETLFDELARDAQADTIKPEGSFVVAG